MLVTDDVGTDKGTGNGTVIGITEGAETAGGTAPDGPKNPVLLLPVLQKLKQRFPYGILVAEAGVNNP